MPLEHGSRGGDTRVRIKRKNREEPWNTAVQVEIIHQTLYLMHHHRSTPRLAAVVALLASKNVLYH